MFTRIETGTREDDAVFLFRFGVGNCLSCELGVAAVLKSELNAPSLQADVLHDGDSVSLRSPGDSPTCRKEPTTSLLVVWTNWEMLSHLMDA